MRTKSDESKSDEYFRNNLLGLTGANDRKDSILALETLSPELEDLVRRIISAMLLNSSSKSSIREAKGAARLLSNLKCLYQYEKLKQQEQNLKEQLNENK